MVDETRDIIEADISLKCWSLFGSSDEDAADL